MDLQIAIELVGTFALLFIAGWLLLGIIHKPRSPHQP
jgi:hypothetical protein